jgi:ABC-2 type transport system ATP-binding protein
MSVIAANELKKSFKVRKGNTTEDFFAVNGVSFSIDTAECVGFIGTNGAGKSTTIKMLTGILRPSSGRVKVFGHDPITDRNSVVPRMGVLFGGNVQLWPQLSLADNIRLVETIYGITIDGNYRSFRSEIMENFQLNELLAKTVNKLSLGELMRSDMAVCLLHRPEVCIFDEPTIGLDILAKNHIRSLLKRSLEGSNTSLFLTSHDMFDIEQLCDRIIVIGHGKVLLDDSLKNIKKRYVQKRIVTCSVDASTIKTDSPHVIILERTSEKLRLEVDIDKISMGDVLKTLLNKYQISDVSIELPSLECIVGWIYGNGSTSLSKEVQ